jgi:tetratricopeptide (TPR) repeat protein
MRVRCPAQEWPLKPSFEKQGDHDMNSPLNSYITKTSLGILVAAVLLFTSYPVPAQEDYTEEQYKQYQEIQAEKSTAKKIDMIVKFLGESPKSGLRKYMIAEYQTAIVGLQQANEWSQVITDGNKFLKVVPNDDFTFKALAVAYSQTKNTKGFASFGEKAYAANPSPQLAYAIADAYRQLGNHAKFREWGQKVLASDPDNIDILYQMTVQYMSMQNTAQAVKYAKTLLSALPKAKKPDTTDAQTWKNTTDAMYATAYGTIGAAAFEKRSYSVAIKNLDNAVKYVKRNDSAYYHLGLSYWQLNKMDAAMLNFAKAYILKGATSNNAKQYLEQLWKSSHRNSLAGMERVIERAEADLK